MKIHHFEEQLPYLEGSKGDFPHVGERLVTSGGSLANMDGAVESPFQ